MIFGNPVRGTIHPHSWSRPAGNLDFRVTQPFGCTGVAAERPFGSCEHFHRAIDLGNGHCGADVLAAAAGTVRSSMLLNGSNVVVLEHGGGYCTGYAHLATRSVVKGAKVSKGQKIGTVGSTGATACHLHFAAKTHVPIGGGSFWEDGAINGEWIDPWPRLAQNVQVAIRASGVRVRVDASLGPIYATADPDGTLRRESDQASLGSFSTMRAWGGTVSGAAYDIGGAAGHTWEKIRLDGGWRYVASPLARLSVS